MRRGVRAKTFARGKARGSSRGGGFGGRKRKSFRKRSYGGSHASRPEVKYADCQFGDGSFASPYYPALVGNHQFDGMVRTDPENSGQGPHFLSCVSTAPELLTGVSQGVHGYQRIGLAVSPKSLVIRGTVMASTAIYGNAFGSNVGSFGELVKKGVPGMGSYTLADSDGNGVSDSSSVTFQRTYLPTQFRIVVFRNMEPGTNLGTGGDSMTWRLVKWHHIFDIAAMRTAVLASTGANPPLAPAADNGTPVQQASVNDFLSIGNRGRFRIVYDAIVNLNADKPSQSFHVNIPVKGPLRWGGDSFPYSAAVAPLVGAGGMAGSTPGFVRAGHYFLMACQQIDVNSIDGTVEINPADLQRGLLNFAARFSFTDQ